MKKNVIQEIKSVAKVSDFLKEIGYEVKNNHSNVPWRKGSDSKALFIMGCGNKWMDFAAGKHGMKEMGDVIDAYELVYECSTAEAMKKLCDKYEIDFGKTEKAELKADSFPISEAKISFIDDWSKTEMFSDTVWNALNLIKGEQMPDAVRERIQEISKCTDDEKRRELKGTLPSFFFQGEFSSRTELKAMSGLCCVDIDKVGNPKEIKEKLKGDSHILAMFISPSGKGLKLVCRIDVEPFKDAKGYDEKISMWKRMYGQLEGYYVEKYVFLKGYIDSCYKELHRGCLLSLDSELYMNVDAEAFKWNSDVINEPDDEKVEEKSVTVVESNEKTVVKEKLDISSLVPPKGLIRDYYDLYAGKTEVPDEAILAGGLCLIASTLVRNVYIEEAMTTYPNIYVIYVGSSGQTKKSTALNFTSNFYYTLMKKPIVHGKAYSELSDAFSMEAIHEELKGNNLMAFVSEYGMMVNQTGYMEKVKDMLVKLWDTPNHIKHSFKANMKGENSGNTQSIAEEPCLSIFGASTVEYFKLAAEHKSGGFLGRHLIFKSEGSGRKIFSPPPIDSKRAQAIREDLLKLSDCKGRMSLSEEAFKYLNNEYSEEVTVGSNAVMSQLSRSTTFWKKLAIILQMSETPDGRVISLDNAKRAVRIFNHCFGNYRVLLNEMGEGDYKKYGDKILDFIRRNNGCTFTDIQRSGPNSLRDNKQRLAEMVQLLVDHEEVIEKVKDNSNGKQSKCYYAK